MREVEIEMRPPALQQKRFCIISIITKYSTFHAATSWTSDKPISALGCVSINLCHSYWTFLDLLRCNPEPELYSTKHSPRRCSETCCCSVLPQCWCVVGITPILRKGVGKKRPQKRAAVNPLAIIYLFLFLTVLNCCKTWTIDINFLTSLSRRIKKFI